MCWGDKVSWVDAAARGGEAVLRVLLADAEASGEPDAAGHPDDRVLDALDVRAPREPFLDSCDVVRHWQRQDLLEWLLFDHDEKCRTARGASRATSRCSSTATDSRCRRMRRRSPRGRPCARRSRTWRPP